MTVTNHISSTAKLGLGVTAWHFTYVGNNSIIGNNVKIGSLVHIDYDVRIGDNTKVEGQVFIPPLTIIGKDCFIGPGVVITNDPYPMCDNMIGVVIKDGAIIGARAVIKAGVTIGKNAVVAMGSVVTKNVPDQMVVMGAPAKPYCTRKEYDTKQRGWLES